MDNALIEDAHKEFSLSMMTSFGSDGGETTRQADFEQVRGGSFEADPFVQSLREHIKTKTALMGTALDLLAKIAS